MSRSLSDWEEVDKEKGERGHSSFMQSRKSHSLCAAKGRQMECEGLPVVRDYKQGATRNFQLHREVILGLEKR